MCASRSSASTNSCTSISGTTTIIVAMPVDDEFRGQSTARCYTGICAGWHFNGDAVLTTAFPRADTIAFLVLHRSTPAVSADPRTGGALACSFSSLTSSSPSPSRGLISIRDQSISGFTSRNHGTPKMVLFSPSGNASNYTHVLHSSMSTGTSLVCVLTEHIDPLPSCTACSPGLYCFCLRCALSATPLSTKLCVAPLSTKTYV